MKKLVVLLLASLATHSVVSGTFSHVNRHQSLRAIPSLEKRTQKSRALKATLAIRRGGASPSRRNNNDSNKNKRAPSPRGRRDGRTNTGSFSNDRRRSNNRPTGRSMFSSQRGPETNKYVTEDAGGATQYQRRNPSPRPRNNVKRKNGAADPLINWGSVNKYMTEDLSKTVTKTVEDVKTNVKSVVPKRDRYIVWGDLGNYVTIVLSFLLLMRTPFDLGPCRPGPCDASGYTGNLDPCYVCDGFCISNPTKKNTNSHMLSLYSDLIFTLPLLSLRKNEDLGRLGLDDFFLSSIKVYSVAGHGIAHWALSVLTRKGISFKNDNTLRNSVAFALFLARFVNSGSVKELQNIVDKLEGKRVNPEEEKRLMVANRNSSTLRARVAPTMAGILLALLADAPPPVDQPTLTNYVVFGLTCFVFFEAGIPPAANNWIFSVLFSGVTAWVAVDLLGVNTIQHSFTIVFTSAYLVSAIYQLFVWDKATKRANPYAYSVSVWGSSVLTTCVGWLLALKCSDMKDIGGHVWYDFSISSSYFLIYYLVKQRFEKKKGNIAY